MQAMLYTLLATTCILSLTNHLTIQPSAKCIQ